MDVLCEFVSFEVVPVLRWKFVVGEPKTLWTEVLQLSENE